METKKEIKSVSGAVMHVMDTMPLGTVFFGHEFHKMVVAIYPKCKKTYVDTILRVARRYRRDSFKCIAPNKSKYERV